MKTIILFLLLSVLPVFAAGPDDLLQRVKIGEDIFMERFSSTRIERLLSRNLADELTRLEKGSGNEYVAKVRKILRDVSTDIAASASFKNEYAGWLAGQLSKAELQRYIEFLRSDLGKKVSDLDDRVQPLLLEAIQRGSRGRLESIPLLMAEARSK